MKDNNRIVYLDNAATTKVSDEVVALFVNSEKDNFANPNSIHALGIKNAKKVQVAKENILKSFRLNKHKVILTSSATEANNLAIKGYCLKYANRGKHIITTNIEHPSVLECFYQLRDQFERFQLKEENDIYIKAKLAGAQNMEEVDNWMEDIHP